MSASPKCRTCLDCSDQLKTGITKTCYLNKTLKEIIVLLVPQMEYTLRDTDVVCINCRSVLRLTMKFIEKCLQTEVDLKDKKVLLGTNCNESLEDVISNPINGTKNGNQFALPPSSIQKCIEPDITSDVQQEHNYFVKTEHLDSTVISPLPKNIENYSRVISLSQPKGAIQDEFVKNLASGGVKIFHVASGPECGIAGTRKKLLLLGAPITKSTTDATFNCTKCNNHFSSWGRFNRHMYLHKIKATMIKCPYCHRYIALNLFEAHKNEHKEKRAAREGRKRISIFKCESCSKEFASKKDYENHAKVHPPVICEQCGKRFPNKAALHMHKIMHNPSISYLCEICGRGYRSRGSFQVHKHAHENHAYMCDRCPRVFNQKFKLQKHLKFVHDPVSRFECTDCGKRFKFKAALHFHYRVMHLKLQPYACQICNKKFGRPDCLRKHVECHSREECITDKRGSLLRKFVPRRPTIKTVDPGKPVPCKRCGKLYQNIFRLKVHLRTHMVQKMYPCKYCDLTYPLKSIKKHELKHVNCDVEFSCNICWKKLKTKKELDVHVARHTNPRYHCDDCGKLFRTKYLLNYHLLQHVTHEDIEKSNQEFMYDALKEFTV